MTSLTNSLLGTGFVANPGGTSDTTMQAVNSLPTTMPSVTSSITSAVGSAISNTVSTATSVLFFNSRFAAIILGLICIAGAILLFVGEDIADALGVGTKSSIVQKGVDAVSA